MGRVALKLAIGILTAAIAAAQPATTTVTDTLRLANGSTFCGGQITLSWTTFTSMDGYRIQGGSLPVAVNPLTGVFSVSLVPTNTNTNPNQGFYSIRYDLRPTICAPATSTWKVPSSGPVGLSGVESISIPPPPQIPVNSLQSPGTAGTFELCYLNGIAQWGTCGGATTVAGTVRQIKVVSSSGTFTLSLPPDLLLGGQSANGTDMLSGSRFTDTTPTGNFLNFKSLGGASLWQVDITGTLQAGTVPFNRLSMTAANVVSLFSGCSGTLLLAANGTCSSAGSGTVTSFSAGNLSPLFTTSVATATTTPALSFSLNTQSANLVFAGPSSGVAATPIFRALVGADLPNPSASTLGGVQSFAAVSHQWINQISTLGVPSASQPGFGDLSGSAACPQLPALTGDTTTSAGSCATTTAKVDGVSYPASPASTNTLPVVTSTSGGGTVTYEQVPNAALVNPSTTVNGQTCTLGSTCTISTGGASTGTFASIPGTCTTGATYDTTDAPYHLVCVSTNTWNYFIAGLGRVYPPSLTSFTAMNLGTSTVSYAQGYGYLTPQVAGGGGSFSARIQHLAVASFTTNITLWIVYSAVANYVSTANCFGGVEVDDGTKLVTAVDSATSSGNRNIQWEKWTNTTTLSATYGTTTGGILMPYVIEKVVIDTSNLTYSVCADLTNCNQYQQHSKTDFLSAATNWGFFATCDVNPFALDVLSFQVIPN